MLDLTIEVRLAFLFVLGTALGSLVNLAAYRLAWNPRPLSPWGPCPEGSVRGWLDRVPIAGWWRLRREARQHSPGFWIRPLLVEFCGGALAAWFYWWAVQQWALLPLGQVVPALPQGAFPNSNVPLLVHAGYGACLLLFALMGAASLIDLDEKIIPDEITLPGTLIGLALAAAYPWSLLPAEAWILPDRVVAVDFLRFNSPRVWPLSLHGGIGLLVALACWWGWCLAMMPLRWRGRRGWGRAMSLVGARIVRDPQTWLGVFGTAVIALVCWLAPAAHWAGLLTALVGMAGGGGLIWLVRIIGTAVLRREAMGFGDVTLMAMIGGFLGWQSTLVIFFLAPCAALLIAVGQWVLHREHEIPYGPFLCLGTLVLIIGWQPIWVFLDPLLFTPWLVPAAMGACLLLLGLLLGVWVILRGWLFGTPQDE